MTRDQTLESGHQRPETRDQRPETRDQRPETRDYTKQFPAKRTLDHPPIRVAVDYCLSEFGK